MDTPSLDDYLAEPRARLEGDARKSPKGREILAAPPEIQIARLRDAFARLGRMEGHPLSHLSSLLALRSLTSAILRRNLPLTEDDLQSLLDSAARAGERLLLFEFLPLRPLLSRTEQFVYLHGLSPRLRAALLKVRDHLASRTTTADRRSLAQITALLEPDVEQHPVVTVPADEAEEGPDDAAITASLFVTEFLNVAAEPSDLFHGIWVTELADHSVGAALLEAPDSVRVAALLESLRRVREASAVEERGRHNRAAFLAHRLIRTPLQYRTEDIVQVLEYLQEDCVRYHTLLLDESVWPLVSRHIARHGLTPELQKCLERCRTTFSKTNPWPGIRDLAHRMNELMGNIRPGLMEPGEGWAETALADLDALSQEERDRWQGLIAHCLTATATNPSQKWQAEAARRVACFDEAILLGTMARWFDLVGQHPTQLSERNATILKGLVWHCRPLLGDDTYTMLGELARACWVKIPDLGPRCAVAGNACLTVINLGADQAATGELTRLSEKITYAVPKARLAQMLKQSGVHAPNTT